MKQCDCCGHPCDTEDKVCPECTNNSFIPIPEPETTALCTT